MLTNIRIPRLMNLSEVPPLDDIEVEERMQHFKQLLYDLEWKKMKNLSLLLEVEINKINLDTKREIAIIEAYYERLEAKIRKETTSDATRLFSLSRLKVLDEMDKNVTDVILAVHQRLGRVDHHLHQTAYKRILYALTVQALCVLLEPAAIVVFRMSDFKLGQSILRHAQAKYKQITGLDVDVVASTQNYLPLESCGGVNVHSLVGERAVINTLAIRLNNILFKANPMIRIALFGINENRQFFDLSEMCGSPTLFKWAREEYDSESEDLEDELDEEVVTKLTWVQNVESSFGTIKKLAL